MEAVASKSVVERVERGLLMPKAAASIANDAVPDDPLSVCLAI